MAQSGDSLGELKLDVVAEINTNDVRAKSKEAADAAKAEWESMFSAIRAGAIAVVAGFTAVAASIFESGLAIDRQARSLGISTDEVQRLRYVAEQAGLQGNDLGEAMGGLAQRVQAAADAGGDAMAHFTDLGIAITDANGATLSSDQLFRNAADALQRMGPGTEQTAAAMQLFGEKGRLLLPVLAQGSEGINRMTAEFDELGGGLDERTIESTRQAAAEFARLKVVLIDAVLPPVRATIDFFRRLSDKTRELIRDFDAQSPAGERLRRTLDMVKVGAAALAIAFAVVKREAIAAGIAAARAWLVAAAPLAAAVAGVGLFILGLDDLITTFEGGDSIIRRVTDSLFGVGTTADVVRSVRAAVWDINTAFVAVGAGVDRVLASINDSLLAMVGRVTHAVNSLLDLAGIAARAAGLDTTGTPLSEQASVQRRVESASSLMEMASTSAALRASASAADRRVEMAGVGRSRFVNMDTSIANQGIVNSLQAGTGAMLQATPGQQFRFDQSSGATTQVSATSRAQVQISGVIDPSSPAFNAAVGNIVADAMRTANTDALEGISKSRRSE